MQQDESDELPELNFGKKMLLWWAYSDIQAEHNFDRLAAEEGEDPRRVKKEVFGLLGKLGKWERVYLICLFDSLAEGMSCMSEATRTQRWRRLSTSYARRLSWRR